MGLEVEGILFSFSSISRCPGVEMRVLLTAKVFAAIVDFGVRQFGVFIWKWKIWYSWLHRQPVLAIARFYVGKEIFTYMCKCVCTLTHIYREEQTYACTVLHIYKTWERKTLYIHTNITGCSHTHKQREKGKRDKKNTKTFDIK